MTYYDPIQTRREQTDAIIAEVCAKHGLARDELMRRTNLHRIAHARHEAWAALYAARSHLSLPQIGAMFGMHHTSILYGIEAHAARVEGRKLGYDKNRPPYKAAAALRAA